MTLQQLEALWRCPTCGGRMTAVAFQENTLGVDAGCLRCDCGAAYPIIRGIPRLFVGAWQQAAEFVAQHHRALKAHGIDAASPPTVSSRRDLVLQRTRESFGFQWTRFGEMACDFTENFFHYLAPLTPEFFKGKLGLDAGCGFGRHLWNAARVGAQMVGIDFSAAIDVSARNTAHLPNVVLAQADLYHAPLAPNSFDVVYAIGVLHHLPEPEAAFHQLVRLVKPGGVIAIWVYSKHRWWSRWLLEGLRWVTVRLPHPVVNALSWIVASVEWGCYIGPYRALVRLPVIGSWLARRMVPRVKVYAGYPFQVSYADWFDRLAAPIRFYYGVRDLQGWFERAGLREAQFSPTGHYGWRACGMKRAA